VVVVNADGVGLAEGVVVMPNDWLHIAWNVANF